MTTPASPLKIVTVTDGRPGNEVQARGIAMALGRQAPAQMAGIRVNLGKIRDGLPQAVLHRFKLTSPKQLSGMLGGASAVACLRDADIVIGAGRRGNLIAAAAKRYFGARTVAILNPQLPEDLFDIIIVPEHDKLSGPKVLRSTGAANVMSPDVIAQAAAQLPAQPQPLLAVLVGGKSKSAKFDGESVERLITDIQGFTDQGYAVFVTPSRRTPAWALRDLQEAFPDANIWDGEALNPYPGILGHAKAVMVTEDSVNMVSEAATTGLPIFISGLGRLSEKFTRFQADMAARGITRPAHGGPVAFSYEPLREADRLAGLILPRLMP